MMPVALVVTSLIAYKFKFVKTEIVAKLLMLDLFPKEAQKFLKLQPSLEIVILKK